MRYPSPIEVFLLYNLLCLCVFCILPSRRPDRPEARVVRSESDGSFTLTLSVPELERAFGKKFKSKTKYKKNTKKDQDAKHCTVSPLGLALLLLLHLHPVPLLPTSAPPRFSATLSPLTFSSSFCHTVFSFLQIVCAGQNFDSRYSVFRPSSAWICCFCRGIVPHVLRLLLLLFANSKLDRLQSPEQL